MSLDINREIASIRNRPGENYAAIALRKIQESVQALEQTISKLPTATGGSSSASRSGTAATVAPATGPAGGDLSGSYPNPMVVKTHLGAPLPVSQGGTGTPTPGLKQGPGVTVTGPWPNQTVAATSAAGGVNLQTASYTIISADSGRLVSFSSASAITATLTGAPSLGTSFFCAIENTGAGALTVATLSGNIDGAATLTLNQNEGINIYCDGANFYTERGTGSGGSALSNLDALKLGHGIFVTAAHTNSSPYQIYTFLSYNGVSWTQFGSSPAISTNSRDPALLHYDGTWWLATTVGGSTPQYWYLYSSTDLLTWSGPSNISTASVGATFTWAPQWFVDADDSVHVFVAIGNSIKTIYEMHPTSRDMSTWSNPVSVLSGTDSFIDANVMRVGDTYYMFFKDDTTGFICLATSTSLTSGWTVTQTGNWAGWATGLSGTIEGPRIVQMDNGKWRLYFTNNSGLSALGVYYSETTDSTFATGWSAASLLSDFNTFNHPVPVRLPSALDMEEYTVSSLNALTGPVTLKAGTNVTISVSGQDITLNSAGGITADYVLMGNGANPPTAMDDGAGNFLYVGYTP